MRDVDRERGLVLTVYARALKVEQFPVPCIAEREAVPLLRGYHWRPLKPTMDRNRFSIWSSLPLSRGVMSPHSSIPVRQIAGRRSLFRPSSTRISLGIRCGSLATMAEIRAYLRGRAPRSAHRCPEPDHGGVNHLVPPWSREQVVVVARYRPTAALLYRDRTAQRVSGMRLARAGNVVAVALDGTRCHGCEILRLHTASADAPFPVGKVLLLKDHADRVERIIFSHVEGRGVFVQ